MENLTGNLIVESIIFESNDTEVLVKGKMEKWGLTYASELLISHSQLNHLLCEMRKKSESSLGWDEIFQSESIGNGDQLYFADIADSPKIPVSIFKNQEEIREIRA